MFLRKIVRRFVFVLALFYFMGIFVIIRLTTETNSLMKSISELNDEASGYNNPFQQTTQKHNQGVNSAVDREVEALKKTTMLSKSRDMKNQSELSDIATITNSLLIAEMPIFINKTIRTTEMEKVDWNDYELMAKESLRRGPGEQGQGYTEMLNATELQLSNYLSAIYNYDAYGSDHISLERSLKDTRTDVCKKKLFLKHMPENSVSFVIIFNNEENSTLLRTVYSIVNRSPKNLLREIVLVDDFSTKEELKAPLEDYISKHFTQVRVVRNKERQGLIRSRMIGANYTSGSFLVFLDAHVEVNVNFLPPLIEPIVLDYRTIVCPMVDNTIESLEVKGLIYRERGAFDWWLVFQRLPVLQEDQSVPHPAPTKIGCAMTVSRKWWEEIVMFDPGLEIWGGEQYEISFKSWMCGGKVVDAPCSRVAHLFRKLPYLKQVRENNTELRNLLRVALVWMDEYKEYVLQRRQEMRTLDPGNLTSQHELRRRLNCKSFDWYMKEVAPDIFKFFPPIEPPLKAWGKIKSNKDPSLCITTVPQSLKVAQCQQNEVSQYKYDWRLQIRELYDKCVTNPNTDYILIWSCFLVEDKPTQMFVWDRTFGRIVNGYTKLCIDYKLDTLQVYTAECNNTSLTQSWTFEGYNSTLVDSTWEQHRHLFHFS